MSIGRMKTTKHTNPFGPNSYQGTVKSSSSAYGKSNTGNSVYLKTKTDNSIYEGGGYNDNDDEDITPIFLSTSPMPKKNLGVQSKTIVSSLAQSQVSSDINVFAPYPIDPKQRSSKQSSMMTYGPLAIEKVSSKEIDGDSISGYLHSFSLGHALDYFRSTRCKPWDNRELDVLDGFKTISFIMCTISMTAY